MSQAIQPHHEEEQPQEPWVPDLPTDTFAQRLRFLRLSLDLSIAEIARQVGVPEATWATWERGSTPRGQGEVVETIHEVTNVNRNWLMWGSTMDRYTDTPVQGRFFDEAGVPAAGLAGRHLVPLPVLS